MALKVYSKKAENMHENEQFRRVVAIIESVFEAENYDGFLIANPKNKDYFYFQPDALLVSHDGFILIDLKDYSGEIITNNQKKFLEEKWYLHTKDGKEVEIKGGSYKNPFEQLKKYGQIFRNILIKELGFPEEYTKSIKQVNIFTDITLLPPPIPREISYYRICDEKSLKFYLCDVSTRNKIKPIDYLEKFLKVFPSEEYNKRISLPINKTSHTIIIDKDIEAQMEEFFHSKTSEIMVLASNNQENRIQWAKHLLFKISSNSLEDKKDQVSKAHLAFSKRIASGIHSCFKEPPQSIYVTIFDLDNNDDIQEQDSEEESQVEIHKIRKSSKFTGDAVFIVSEAHLISNSFMCDEEVRFGSGRLLNDLLEFIYKDEKNHNRKVIFIGDPYCLSYGNHNENALDEGTLYELVKTNITYFKDGIKDNFNSGIKELQTNLCKSIENGIFNSLSYKFDETLKIFDFKYDEIIAMMREWFVSSNTPHKNALLFYTNEECKNMNNWIKREVLKNGNLVAAGDLLIFDNSIKNTLGGNFEIGSYLKIVNVGERVSHKIQIKRKKEKLEIELCFLKIEVIRIEETNNKSCEISILEDCLYEGKISNIKRQAWHILKNREIKKMETNKPFKENEQYREMIQEVGKEGLSREKIDRVVKKKINKEEIDIKDCEAEEAIFKKFYNYGYKKELEKKLFEEKPYLVYSSVRYGWAITVHKSLGNHYDNVILNSKKGDNLGYNDDYFRWLYSASLCANEVFYIQNPLFISPFSNCRIDTSHLTTQSPKKPILICKNKIEKYSDLDNNNVRWVIFWLAKKLEEIDFKICRYKKCNDYLHKVELGRRDEKLVLDIHSKGKDDGFGVSGIKIDKADVQDRDKINKILEDIFDGYGTQEIGKNIFGDFRDEVYNKLKSLLLQKGYTIRIKASHDYQDIFTMQKENKRMEFSLWYNLDGFFTKIEIKFASNQEMCGVLEEVLRCI